MTIPLTTLLREKLAFDSDRANMLAKEHRERTMLARERQDGKSLGDRIKTACYYAAKEENSRLQPTLELLLAVVEAAEKSQTWWSCSGCDYPDLPHDCDVRDEIRSDGRLELDQALSRLRESVGK